MFLSGLLLPPLVSTISNAASACVVRDATKQTKLMKVVNANNANNCTSASNEGDLHSSMLVHEYLIPDNLSSDCLSSRADADLVDLFVIALMSEV